MKHIIIGTAGHVDHGKTCLIKALSGIDTDRLAEEKKRGITIELGFAWLDLPSGQRVGIVDVPGHERFIRNMLAGAGGVDLALLIVAADEGVMPQTREHLEILQLLDIKRGIIVLTKADLVDEEWLEIAKDDVRSLCADTFLAQAPLIPVSAFTSAGIPELIQQIQDLAQACPPKSLSQSFRQPIDRVFTMAGFGTVVTGTIVEGTVKTGDTLMLYPAQQTVRVRNIQVHGSEATEAVAGQRAALNLAQVSKQEVLRGNVLAAVHSLDPSLQLDVKVQVLAHSPYSLKNKSRLHFHCGSSEQLCRATVIGQEEIAPGASGFLRLDLEEEVALKQGDHFVLRFYSPLLTIGGGVILDPAPVALKIKRNHWEEKLKILETGEVVARFVQALDSQSPQFLPLSYAARRAGLFALTPAERSEVYQRALAQKKAVALNDQIWLSTTYLEKLSQKALQILAKYHSTQTLKTGLKREEMRSQLLPELKVELSDKVIQYMIQAAVFGEAEGRLSHPDFVVKLTPEQKKAEESLVQTYKAAGFAPPDTATVLSGINRKLKPEALLSDLIDKGELVRLEASILMHASFVSAARGLVIARIQAEGALKLADFRDEIKSSRKFAVALLDYFDREKLTRLQGEQRILL